MSNDVVATLKADTSALRSLFSESAFQSGKDYLYQRLYIYIDGEKVQTIGSTYQNSPFSHCTFENDYFESVEGECEAVINVHELLSYFDLASGGNTMTVEFEKDNDSRLAQRCTMRGKVRCRVLLAGSESVLKQIPLQAIKRFDDGVFCDSEGEQYQTLFNPTDGDMQRIIEAVSLHSGQNSYPIVVRNDNLVLDIDTGGESVFGQLCDAKGPDVMNYYGEEFEYVFDTLRGDLKCSTNPDSYLSVVSDKKNYTHRTAIANEVEL